MATPRKTYLPRERELDDLDERILWELVADGRISNRQLAEKLGVSPSTTLLRTNALRERGVLRSFHAQVDYAALGLPLQALVFVRLRTHANMDLRAYAQRVVRLAPVVNVFFMGGADDFVIHVVCANSDHLRDFVSTSLSKNDAVMSTQTHVLFDHLYGAQNLDDLQGWDAVRSL